MRLADFAPPRSALSKPLLWGAAGAVGLFLLYEIAARPESPPPAPPPKPTPHPQPSLDASSLPAEMASADKVETWKWLTTFSIAPAGAPHIYSATPRVGGDVRTSAAYRVAEENDVSLGNGLYVLWKTGGQTMSIDFASAAEASAAKGSDWKLFLHPGEWATVAGLAGSSYAMPPLSAPTGAPTLDTSA